MVGKPSCTSSSGRVSLPKGQEWLEVPPKGSGVVGRPSMMVGRPYRRARSGREALTEGRE